MRHGYVTKLRLDINNLQGTLPAELGNLPELLDLDLSSNEIAGGLPVELGTLSKLQGLYLAHNVFTGTIPSQLGNLPDLDYLGLNNNKLAGPIPSELGALTSLRHLYLADNRLTGSVPSELGNLTGLQFLWLTNNLLEGTIPTELSQLPGLLRLYLDNNNLSGELPAQLGDLPAVRRIYLDNNALEGPLPPSLAKLSHVDYFWYHDTLLCDPEDATLTAWLDGIEHLRTSEILCSVGPPATLVVTKTVVGQIPDTDWAFHGSGAIGDFTLAAAGETVTHTVFAGTYVISETVPPGYTAEVACSDGQHVAGGSISIALTAGAHAGCTFTNTAEPAALTVVKQVIGPVPGSDWDFSGSDGIGSFSLPAAGGSEVFTPTAGSYAITETTQMAYIATVACTDGSTGSSSVRVSLEAGEGAACTFVNACDTCPLPATLVVTKTVVGDAPDSAWEFAGTGSIGQFELPAAGGVTAFAVGAGVYTVTEAMTAGYTVTTTCTDGSTGGEAVTVTLSPGSSVGCTFQNSKTASPQTGSVRGVVYEDVNGNGEVDPGEGIEAAMVTIFNAVPYSQTTYTAVDGVYVLDDVPVGEYMLAVAPPPGFETPAATRVSVVEGETVAVDPIAAEPESEITISLPVVTKQ